jgi:hypothetical protein
VDRDAAALLAGLADHALPGKAELGLAGLHRRAGDARAARNAGELGDLAVRRDAAAGNAAHDRVDPAIQLAHVGRVGGHTVR